MFQKLKYLYHDTWHWAGKVTLGLSCSGNSTNIVDLFYRTVSAIFVPNMHFLFHRVFSVAITIVNLNYLVRSKILSMI